MQDIDIAALSRTVLWAAFALAVIFGAIAQRTHFCTMGAVSDILTMGDWSRSHRAASAGRAFATCAIPPRISSARC